MQPQVCVPVEAGAQGGGGGGGTKVMRVGKELARHLEGLEWKPMPAKEVALTRFLQVRGAKK